MGAEERLVEALNKAREYENDVLKDTRKSIVRIQLVLVTFIAVLGCILLGYDPAPASAAESTKAKLLSWRDDLAKYEWFDDMRVAHLERLTRAERDGLWSRWGSVSAFNSLTNADTMGSLFERIRYRGSVIVVAARLVKSFQDQPDPEHPVRNGADLKKLPAVVLNGEAAPAPGAPPPLFSFAENWPLLEEEADVTETDLLEAIVDRLKTTSDKYSHIAPDLASASLVGATTFSPWSDWRLGEFRYLTDDECTRFQQLNADIETQWPDLFIGGADAPGAPPKQPLMTRGMLSVKSYVSELVGRLNVEAKRRQDQRVRVVEVWKLPVAIPVEGVLFMLIPAVLLTQAVLTIVQGHARARRVRLGTVEATLAAAVPGVVGGAVVGTEWANNEGAVRYIATRQWGKLFEDDPNRFTDLFFSAAVWVLVGAISLQGRPILAGWWHSGLGTRTLLIVAIAGALGVLLLAVATSRQLLRAAREWAQGQLDAARGGRTAAVESETDLKSRLVPFQRFGRYRRSRGVDRAR